MRLPDDDELYEVDQTYLGPPGRYLGQFRHKAIFAWMVIGPLGFVLMRRIGVPLTLLTVGLLLIGTVALAMVVADHVTPEQPIAAVVLAGWHDLTTPRRPRPQSVHAGRQFGRVSAPRGVWARYERRRAREAERRAEEGSR